MADMIDGPIRVGIAALIASIAIAMTNVRPRDRPKDRARLRASPDGEGGGRIAV